MAVAALLRADYEVYKNASPNGNSDLIVSKDGKLFRVQVKAFYTRRNGLIAETRSSARGTNRYKHYAGLVDKMAFVDTMTAEVFLTDVPKQATQTCKNKVAPHRI